MYGLNKKAIEGCNVIKEAVEDGEGIPLVEELNGRIYCQGYQICETDDEPYYECKKCTLNIFHYS